MGSIEFLGLPIKLFCYLIVDRLRSFRLAFVEKWKIKRNIIILYFAFLSSQREKY